MTKEEIMKDLEERYKKAKETYEKSGFLPDHSYNMGYFDMIGEIMESYRAEINIKDVSKIEKLENSKVDFEFSKEYKKMESARNIIIISKLVSRVYSKVNELVDAINEERK